MKVAVASSGLGHVSRGVEAWAFDLSRALHNRGLNATLFKGGDVPGADFERVLPCWKRGEERTQAVVRCVPRRLGWRLGLASAYDVEQTTFALRLIGALRRDGFHILHVQDPLVARLAQRAANLGIHAARVILGHGTEEPLEVLRKIEFVQHLAPWHMEQAREAGVWRKGWTAIPNFVDTSTFTPNGSDLRQELGIAPESVVVLTAAAIKRHHKRTDYLIHEFAKCIAGRPDANEVLIVAGGHEPDTDDLVRWGRTLLGDRVRFLVRFPRERMPELYRTANVFVLCSLTEMMPIALMEAMACGLPCTIHRYPVGQWMVGPSGVLIDMREDGALAREIRKICSDLPLRRKLSAAARVQCVQHFGVERVVESICEYYRHVLQGDVSDHPRAVAPHLYWDRGGRL